MKRITLLFGAALVLIAVVTYLAFGADDLTALIPALIGVPMILAGLAMGNPGMRLYGLYAAAGLAILMAMGSLRGVMGLFRGEVSFVNLLQVFLILICAAFLVGVFRALGGEGDAGEGGSRAENA